MFSLPTALSLFPVYLLPSLPLHRRKRGTDTANSALPINPAVSPDIATKETYLSGHSSHLRCAKCATDICFTSQIISKGFTGRHGRAYLVSPSPSSTTISATFRSVMTSCLPNTKTDGPSRRQLVTGVHTVSDVRCAFCESMLGWKYDGAEEESQRYKVGKYILETKMVFSSSDWEHEEIQVPPSSLQKLAEARGRDGAAIEFDSEDEDECEDLFAGVWNPNLALKRKRHRQFRNVRDAKGR
ncbi:MAG: hypothetical protein Q9163_006414 [Psora crenata]